MINENFRTTCCRDSNPSTVVVDSMEVLHAAILDRKSEIVFEAGWDRLTLTDYSGPLQSGQSGRNGKFCPFDEFFTQRAPKVT